MCGTSRRKLGSYFLDFRKNSVQRTTRDKKTDSNEQKN